MKCYDIAFIGVGASALMASVFLDKKLKVAFFEKSSKIAPKVLVSGGGKCNFTNKRVSSENYLGGRDFVKSVLSSFSNRDLLDFLKSHGLEYELRESGKYFCKKSSKELLDIFIPYLKRFELYLNSEITDVIYDNDRFTIKSGSKKYRSKKVVISSGGLSFKNLGATPVGYEIAEKFSHSITPLSPALVGFTLQKEQFWMKSLSGISLDVCLHVKQKRLKGSMLFTHKGISGPVVLNASLYWEKGGIRIDFLPNKSMEKILNTKTNKSISRVLELPRRFTKEFLKSLNIEDKAISKLNKDEIKELKKLKSYSFSPAGNFGYSKAEVTKGGIRVDEIDKKSMQSKLQKDLYFLGEISEITGELGGYNIQWAFSTAYKFAKSV